ncbi:MAG: CoA-binding protein [Acidobacteria bacterium]|nr:CoA-binding protein [Acidobacteriota bacterium]|tara:strand:- start:7845 stop:8225 length:381 start_codon:yes stop_codon:yes gene_type:complete
MAQVVAVVGASGNRRKFGNKAVRAFLNRGYEVIPINPRGVAIEGLETFTSILDVPGTIDLATVYVQPWIGPAIMDELAHKGITKVWLNPGADAPAVVSRAQSLGLRPILNCSIVGIGESPSSYPDQ